MIRTIQLVVILISFFILLFCLAGGWAFGQVTAPSPTPTPMPTPDSDGAAIVRETFDGLEAIGVGKAIGSGADANNANTAAVHRSWVGDIVQDLLPVLPLCIVSVPAGALVIVVLAVLAFLWQRRGDPDLVRLTAVMESLERLASGGS